MIRFPTFLKYMKFIKMMSNESIAVKLGDYVGGTTPSAKTVDRWSRNHSSPQRVWKGALTSWAHEFMAESDITYSDMEIAVDEWRKERNKGSN